MLSAMTPVSSSTCSTPSASPSSTMSSASFVSSSSLDLPSSTFLNQIRPYPPSSDFVRPRIPTKHRRPPRKIYQPVNLKANVYSMGASSRFHSPSCQSSRKSQSHAKVFTEAVVLREMKATPAMAFVNRIDHNSSRETYSPSYQMPNIQSNSQRTLQGYNSRRRNSTPSSKLKANALIGATMQGCTNSNLQGYIPRRRNSTPSSKREVAGAKFEQLQVPIQRAILLPPSRPAPTTARAMIQSVPMLDPHTRVREKALPVYNRSMPLLPAATLTAARPAFHQNIFASSVHRNDNQMDEIELLPGIPAFDNDGGNKFALPQKSIESEPVFANSKQYHRIIKRRDWRSANTNTIDSKKKGYRHKSRHLHAKRRQRGERGRFAKKGDDIKPPLTSPSMIEIDSNSMEIEKNSAGSESSLSLPGFPVEALGNLERELELAQSGGRSPDSTLVETSSLMMKESKGLPSRGLEEPPLIDSLWSSEAVEEECDKFFSSIND